MGGVQKELSKSDVVQYSLVQVILNEIPKNFIKN